MRVLRHPLYPHPLPPPSTPKTLKVGLPERLGKTSILKSSYKCLSLITLDFVIRANKKYYPKTLLEECKYKIMIKYVNHALLGFYLCQLCFLQH